MITELLITTAQLRTLQETIKKEFNYSYLTKKRCKQSYGFDWVSRGPKCVAYGKNIKLRFYSEKAQTMYQLKWG